MAKYSNVCYYAEFIKNSGEMNKMYKSNVGDFPLKVHPCKYWWVRYAVSCLYFTKKQAEMLEAYIEHVGLPRWSAYSGSYENREIWIDGDSPREQLEQGSETYKAINNFILKYNDHMKNNDKMDWVDCPFESEDQSACPFYEMSDFYKDIPLEELRKRSGYDV